MGLNWGWSPRAGEWVATGAALLLIATGFFGARPAEAAPAPEFLMQIGSPGEAAGQVLTPMGVAIDPASGHLFAAELEQNRVSEFTSWGVFVRALGWDVAPGAVNEQQELRVRAASGQFRLSFGAGGPGVSETGDLPAGASAAAVQSALNGLSNISAGGGAVSVSANLGKADGTVAYVYVIAFTGGPLKEADVAQLGATNGTVPLAGGSPSTVLEASTRADGIAAGTGLEACTAESGCRAGASGSGAGQFTSPSGIAVDSSHNVYVVDQENHRVEKFDSAGRFQLTFGKGVNSGTSGNANLCTKAGPPSDVCGTGETGTGPGEFSAWPESSFIAVGPDGKVYVGDANRIEKFSGGGAFEGEIALPGKGQTQGLAIDSEGSLYVLSEGEADKVSRYDSSGAPKDFTAGSGAGTNTIEVSARQALAIDSANDFYVVKGIQGSSNYEVLGFQPDGAALFPPFVAGVVTSLGVAASPKGDLYVADINAQASKVNVFGPEPDYENPPDIAPEIKSQYIAAVGSEGATVSAEIAPHFWNTDYYVQYGTADCSANPCAEQPLPPGNALGGRRGTLTASVTLGGLAPETVYHFRFVAKSEAPANGGPVFGADHVLTTRRSTPHPGLPEGRLFELVSPTEKDNGEVGVPAKAAGQSEFNVVMPKQASPDGEAITYTSFTAFGEADGAPTAAQYVSRRGAGGWLTENISPHFEEGYVRDPFVGFSEDLAHAAVHSYNPPLAAGAPAGTWNLYSRDNASGDYTAISAVVPEVGAELPCLGFSGASESFDRVIFAARNESLIPGNPIPSERTVNLYEWTPGGGLALASVLPGGTPATPQGSTGFGAGYDFAGTTGIKCGMGQASLRHAISADGRRMFWSYPTAITTPFVAQAPVLFARLIRPGGPETVELDANQGGGALFGGKGVYRDASRDGSKVFFTTNNKLTESANAKGGTDLYRYDVAKYEAGDPAPLANLTAHPEAASNVLGVLGVSEKGDYAYFAAQGVLTTTPNSEGDTPTLGQSNVYAWHEGDAKPHFVATVPDAANWSANPSAQSAGVSPNGLHLAFTSTAPLTGYDNTIQGTTTQASEVFVYDLLSEKLDCASCSPTGARPLGSSSVPGWRTPFAQPRYIVNGGQLFLQSKDALSSNDTNGKQDVYEFERAGTGSCSVDSPSYSAASSGCQYLISSGTSDDASYFVDASSDARDAFVATRERLVPQLDQDTAFDIYDARIGGSPPAEIPAPCEGEACLGEGTHPSPSSAAGTPTFAGPGNPPIRRPCPKGKVRRAGKERCVLRHRHHKHKRTTHARRRAAR
jgi:hypothetical protein